MRRGIEQLAFLLSKEGGDPTIGQLSAKYEEPIERIMDALDVLKIRQGVPTTIPHVPWTEG